MAAPAAITGYEAAQGLLGVNPLETLMRDSGEWALIFLLAALAIAPLRHALVTVAKWRLWCYGKRLSDWNWLIRLRRPVGLASFFYAAAHLILYVTFDLDFNWSELLIDLRAKPYIGVGITAFALLTPLAITSTDAWMRRLKRDWKRLHMLIYPAAVLALAHFVLLSKPGVTDYFWYGLALAGLLGYRITDRWRRGETRQDRIDGAVPERPAQQAAGTPGARHDHHS